MKTVIHKADSRGMANHGWLQAKHSFSFANYYNRERMNFGVLRVLNDDIIAGGEGFGMHPHDNMEIITIPLKGDLAHSDNMGNSAVIKQGDIQVMSAGTGVYHSEFNPNADEETQLFQIWLLPNKQSVEPRYQQMAIRDVATQNSFYQVLSPSENDQGVWIHQNAWFNLGSFDKGKTDVYKLNKNENGVYLMVISGDVEVAGTVLNKRDAIGISETESVALTSNQNSEVLLMEIPMERG